MEENRFVGRPTSSMDLDVPRSHNWYKDKPECMDCGLMPPEDKFWFIYTAPRPGSDFQYVGHLKNEICTGKHCLEHNPPMEGFYRKGPYPWSTKRTTTSPNEDTVSDPSLA